MLDWIGLIGQIAHSFDQRGKLDLITGVGKQLWDERVTICGGGWGGVECWDWWRDGRKRVREDT
jgi:hypothetical protein